MSFEADLKAHLQGASAISNVVADRITPVIRQQGAVAPAITYQIVTTDQISHLAGRSDTLRHIRLQIDMWSRDHSEVMTLATAVRARMDTAAATFRSVLLPAGFDDYEPDTKLYRRSLEFSCWFNET